MSMSANTISRWKPTQPLDKEQLQSFSERQDASGLPSLYRQANLNDLSDYRIPVLQAIDRIKDGTSKGILLSGKPGIGKTYAACAVLNSFFSVGRGLFLRMGDIKKSAFSNSRSDDSLARVKGTGLLLLDDLGQGKQSQWLLGVIHEVLDARISSERPTIVTTNFQGSLFQRLACEGEAETAAAIVSRLKELTWIKLEGEDRRGIKPV